MVRGVIRKTHTKDFEFKGRTRHCSPEEQQYEIACDKTDHVTVRKGSALKKVN